MKRLLERLPSLGEILPETEQRFRRRGVVVPFQIGEEPVSDSVAEEPVVEVAPVERVGDTAAPDVRFELRAAAREERSHEDPSPRGDSLEAPPSRAPDDVMEYRFDLVVPVVSERDGAGVPGARRLFEKTVSEESRRFLDPFLRAARLGGNVSRAEKQGNFKLARRAPDERALAARLGTDSVVEMSRSELDAHFGRKLRKYRHERHRIGSARNRRKHPCAGRDHPAGADVIPDLFDAAHLNADFEMWSVRV